MEELKSHLKDLGANYVATEEDLKSSEMKETMKVGLALHKSHLSNTASLHGSYLLIPSTILYLSML